MFEKTSEPKTAKRTETDAPVQVSDAELGRVTGGDSPQQGRKDIGGYVPTS